MCTGNCKETEARLFFRKTAYKCSSLKQPLIIAPHCVHCLIVYCSVLLVWIKTRTVLLCDSDRHQQRKKSKSESTLDFAAKIPILTGKSCLYPGAGTHFAGLLDRNGVLVTARRTGTLPPAHSLCSTPDTVHVGQCAEFICCLLW